MQDRVTSLPCVVDLKNEIAGSPNNAAITDLTTAFGIERCSVEHQYSPLALGHLRDGFIARINTDHAC